MFEPTVDFGRLFLVEVKFVFSFTVFSVEIINRSHINPNVYLEIIIPRDFKKRFIMGRW